ncbi:MAG: hypothetical protein ACJAZX_000390 [Rickettsiales bacterium]|jgi:hypothetical protein
MDSNEKIEAKILIETYGCKAIEVAQRRVDDLIKYQHSKASDFGYRILNEVEKIIEKQNLQLIK